MEEKFEFVISRECVNVNEEWKWIKGYEGLYEISTYGNVRNNYKQRIRTFETRQGTMVKLKKDGFYELFIVPLLIFAAFYARPGDFVESFRTIRPAGPNDVPRLF